MKKGGIQVAVALAAAGIVICLIIKKISEKNRKNRREKKENEFTSRQRQKFPDAYGEYTL